MANPNLTDMTEEDAADLQFPKENTSRVVVVKTIDDNVNDSENDANVDDIIKENTESDKYLEVSVVTEEIFASEPVCRTCKTTLSEPYVRCAECRDIEICLVCFSNGCEINEHKNMHNYVIVKNEFPLIKESGWTARQELELLDVLQECGFGNWIDVARKMQGKTAEECKIHYLSNYIDRQSLPGLPRIKDTRTSLFASETVPYMFKLQELEEPPRFATNSLNCRFLAGYNAARSDFEVNFDNHAELLVSDLNYEEFEPDDTDYTLGINLQTAIVQAYNNRLKERMRRRKIIRDHGLIAFRRTMSWLKRYETTISRPITERLLIFMQLVRGIEFDYLVEGLHRVGEIKNYMNKLIGYRKNGLKSFHSVGMYKELSRLRLENDKDRKQYLNNAEYCWKSVLPDSVVNPSVTIASVTSQRKIPPPLEIQGLPESEKLTNLEKELCSNARVIPSSYFEYKRILTSENKKIGSLRLAQARVLLKIDVNKTRKIYDFLTDQGYINKPPQ